MKKQGKYLMKYKASLMYLGEKEAFSLSEGQACFFLGRSAAIVFC